MALRTLFPRMWSNVVECGRALSKHMRLAMIQQEWPGSNDPAPVMRLPQGTAASRHGVGAISDSPPVALETASGSRSHADHLEEDPECDEESVR